MEIMLKLEENFSPDDATNATVMVYKVPEDIKLPLELIGTVAVDFCGGETADQHVIETVLPGMVHYMQANVIMSACLMIDSHFDEEVTPYAKQVCDV